MSNPRDRARLASGIKAYHDFLTNQFLSEDRKGDRLVRKPKPPHRKGKSVKAKTRKTESAPERAWKLMHEEMVEFGIGNYRHISSPSLLRKLRSALIGETFSIKSTSDTAKGLDVFLVAMATKKHEFALTYEDMKLPYSREEMGFLSKYKRWKLLHLSLSRSNKRSEKDYSLSTTLLSIDTVPSDTTLFSSDADEYFHWKFTLTKNTTDGGVLGAFGVVTINYGHYLLTGGVNYTRQDQRETKGSQQIFLKSAPSNECLHGLLLGTVGLEHNENESLLPCATRVVLIPDNSMSVDKTGLTDISIDGDTYNLIGNEMDNDWGMLLSE